MRTAAIVPARGGSKRIPRKNVSVKLDGLTLVEHAIAAASLLDECWVSTDDAEIASVAARAGARVVMRPAHLATDTSPTEDAIRHWLRSLRSGERPDVCVLLQPSTPILGASVGNNGAHHVKAATSILIGGENDSVVAVEQSAHRAFDGRIYPREGELPEWRPWRPVMSRPRTQDVRPMGTECGAFWAFTREHFERTGCRQGGDCRAYVLPRWSCVDIDDPEDLEAAAALLAMHKRRAVYVSGGG